MLNCHVYVELSSIYHFSYLSITVIAIRVCHLITQDLKKKKAQMVMSYCHSCSMSCTAILKLQHNTICALEAFQYISLIIHVNGNQFFIPETVMQA